MASLDIAVQQDEGQTRVVLAGELDIASTERLEQELAAIERNARGTLVLDMRQVEFIDSTGLRTLIAANERARSGGRRLAIVPGSNAVERLLSVTKLDQRLELVEDPESLEP
jgi:anti-anti-sigma factor